jgi:short-subunit dehydrogenase
MSSGGAVGAEGAEGVAMSFAGRVAVITGASTGIGHALAKELARQGCKVGLLARRRELLDGLAEEIDKAGGTAAVAVADVAERAQVLEAVAAVKARLGPVDLLVANAGVGAPTTLEPPNTADVERMFRVNVFGVVYAIEAVIGDMLARRSGHLAAVSSLAAYKGLPGESGYCASKAAVNTYLEGLRIQLRGRGVAVTTICPGFVKTPMTAHHDFHMPFLLEADDAARRIVRALRRKVKVFNFPWPLSLLMRLSRWAPDWAVARSMKNIDMKAPPPQVP